MIFLKNYLKIFHNYIKIFFFISQINIKKSFFGVLNISMIDLLLDELKLVAKNRNIRYYEKNPKKSWIRVLSEPKPKIKIDKKKLEEIRKGFYEFRHKFSKTEIDKNRKKFL